HFDKFDALSGPADFAELGDLHLEHDSSGSDQHELIGIADASEGNDRAITLCGSDVDHAASAALLQAIFLNICPLAKSIFADGQQVHAGADDGHVDHNVVALQGNAAYACRRSAHGPDIGLLEANGHAAARAENNFVLTREAWGLRLRA